MQQGKSKRAFLKNLLRYFGFPLVAAAVMMIAFFALQSQIVGAIRKGTYQILEDTVRQQTNTLDRYVELITLRVQLIANYDSDTGPNTLVESLRTELQGDAEIVEIGYANLMGDLLNSDRTRMNVRAEDWFLRSLNGETVVTTSEVNKDSGMRDVLVSAHVDTHTGVRGVLFATLSNQNFSKQLNTLAYEGAAKSFVCDATGKVLFVEKGMTLVKVGDPINTFINNQVLGKEVTIDQLKEKVRQDQIATFRIRSSDQVYYAACEKLDAYDWYVFSVVSSDTADVIARQVSSYHMAMLCIILLIGVSMAAQAYGHERETVKTLEADKDLLRQSTQNYQLISQLSDEVFFLIKLDTGEISFNDSFVDMFGCQPPACKIDNMDHCTNFFFEQDWQVFASLINQLRAGDAEARAELRMIDVRGIVHWKRVEIFSVFDQDKQAVQLVGKIVDIHRQKQSMQRLIRQADSDPLTGLLNRGAMERNIKAYLTGEGLGGRHALIMLDFDNFKTVNDTLGHAKGDHLLVSFANGMRRLFRSGDYLSRIGGDEYMAFIKNASDDGVALDKAEALREEMAGLSRKIGIPVSISVGIAVYNRDGESFEKLYKAADEALYHVKRSGKDAISFFSTLSEPMLRHAAQTQEDDGDNHSVIDGMDDDETENQ